MTLVTASIDIDAPRERVYDLVLDPARLDDWVTIHRRVNHARRRRRRARATRWSRRCACAAPTSRSAGRSPRPSRPDRATWEGRGPAHSYARTSYGLADRDGGRTRFDYENEFKAPGGFLGAAASRVLVGGVPQREADRSLQRLKELLENGRPSGSTIG